ncbi:MAG: 50S ribosomal protein L35 [Phycisphaerae bacterium]
MPKMKTHKGLGKRVKVTARGKVKRRKAFTGHLLSGRPGRRLRRLKKAALMPKADARKVLFVLGN